jgi:hypothetical protein
MTIESRELASAKAYIESRGLTAPFEEFHQARENARLEEAKPEFEICRSERNGNRRRSDAYANITPWLRKATSADIQRLIDIDPERLPDEGEDDNDDVKFLDEIWYSKPDEDYDDIGDDDDMTWSYYGCFKIDVAELTTVIKIVNPNAYRHLFMTPEELGQAALPL